MISVVSALSAKVLFEVKKLPQEVLADQEVTKKIFEYTQDDLSGKELLGFYPKKLTKEQKTPVVKVKIVSYLLSLDGEIIDEILETLPEEFRFNRQLYSKARTYRMWEKKSDKSSEVLWPKLPLQ